MNARKQQENNTGRNEIGQHGIYCINCDNMVYCIATCQRSSNY